MHVVQCQLIEPAVHCYGLANVVRRVSIAKANEVTTGDPLVNDGRTIEYAASLFHRQAEGILALRS